MSGKVKAIKQLIGWSAAAIIIYFLVRQLYGNWDEIASGDWKIDWLYLFLSTIVLFIAYLFLTQAWRLIIFGFGLRPGFIGSFRVMYLAQLGRYIPGKIWQVVGMVGLAKQIGIPASVSLASFALAQIYYLPAAFILVPILLGDPGKLESLKFLGDIFYIFAAILAVIFLAIFLIPRGIGRLLNFALRLLKKEEVSYNPSFVNRLAIFAIYLISWILMGISFKLFIIAVSPETEITYTFAAGTYIASYVIGYLSIIAPGGLGVREAIMAAIMRAVMPFPSATLIAFASRFFITIVEAAISLLALLTYRYKRSGDNSGTDASIRRRSD
jgi:uncharacterized membrane protein YbhN (UPF0104 family)